MSDRENKEAEERKTEKPETTGKTKESPDAGGSSRNGNGVKENQPQGDSTPGSSNAGKKTSPVEHADEDRQTKIKAAAAAKAKAAAAAKAKAAAAAKRPDAKKKEEPPEPSPKQPLLDEWVRMITEQIGDGTVEESYINRPNDHLPTLVIRNDRWLETARLLKESEALSFDYLQNLSGVDYEEHMEAVYHLWSMKHRHAVCIRVKTDRENPSIPSVVSIWAAADWNEREAYDLLGIRFPGHPNLKRILMPDDWVGHPLRKDYEPYDREV